MVTTTFTAFGEICLPLMWSRLTGFAEGQEHLALAAQRGCGVCRGCRCSGTRCLRESGKWCGFLRRLSVLGLAECRILRGRSSAYAAVAFDWHGAQREVGLSCFNSAARYEGGYGETFACCGRHRVPGNEAPVVSLSGGGGCGRLQTYFDYRAVPSRGGG